MSGLYLHIPYCRQACHYCDFHFSTSLGTMEAMIAAMRKEMEIRSGYWAWKNLDSVYLGGGTPSILPAALLEDLFHEIHLRFSVKPGAEITLEANPDDVNPENLRVWKALGINRLSIGLQSSHGERLSWMNRIHSGEEGRKAVRLAQEMGFQNLTLDLMYQFPGSTAVELDEDIDALLSLEPQHISAYGLTLEPQTVFGHRLRKGQLLPLPEEQAALQFHQVHDRLQAAGFEGYEISNFGRPGFFAVHNTAYWFQNPYLGIGPGAHGYNGRERYHNRPNNSRYIKSLLQEGRLFDEIEALDKEQQANERILTRLRTQWGLNLQEFKAETGFELEEVRQKEIDLFVSRRELEKQDGILRLTRAGKLLADRIAMELML